MSRWCETTEDMLVSPKGLPITGTPLTMREAMELALTVSLAGCGYVSPNPMVGCVVLDRHGNLVSHGAHLIHGQSHAEVNALNKARQLGADLTTCTLYVTLEPCAHEGQTGSCADLICKENIGKVFYALQDPNPEVAGKGAARIREAGILCEKWIVLGSSAEYISEIFCYNQRTTMPFIGAKVATDLNGVIASKGDQRVFITGARARSYGHYLRMRYDAIGVGSDTLIQDDPELGPRNIEFQGREPFKVIFDGSGRGLGHFSGSSPKILESGEERVLWVVKHQKFLDEHQETVSSFEKKGARFFVFTAPSPEFYALLEMFKIKSLLLEGGAGLWKTFLEAGCVQRIHWFKGPKESGADDPIYFHWKDELAQKGFIQDHQTQLDQDSLSEFFKKED